MSTARTLFCLLLSLLVTPAFAQTTAEIFGTLVDASGASIAGAKLTARNQATNLTFTNTSQANGNFRLPRYRLVSMS